MTPIEACDIALEQVCGLEIVAALAEPKANEKLVKACKIVLDGLLERRISLPLQRRASEDTPT